MSEETQIVTMKGNPVTLFSQIPGINQRAPDVVLVNNEFKNVELSSFFDKLTIICSVPSLDTEVCDREVRNFNEEIGHRENINCLTISMDLPFAQKRWCGNANINNVITLSDYREGGFGKAWGVLIKENRLLARAVFIVDQSGILRFTHLVPEITAEPDYKLILDKVDALFSGVS